MRIVAIETFQVPPRWLFIRVATDEGLVGWGEPIVEGRAETVTAAVDTLAGYLVGQGPMHVADHWQVLTEPGFHRGRSRPVLGRRRHGPSSVGHRRQAPRNARSRTARWSVSRSGPCPHRGAR